MIKFNIGVDLDGTILNSWRRHIVALESVCPRIKSEVSSFEEKFIDFKSNGGSTLEFLEECRIPSPDFYNIHWIQIIENDELLQGDRLYPQALSFLKYITKHSVLFLATARKRKEAVLSQVDELGLSQFFKQVFVVKPGPIAGRLKADNFNDVNLDFIIGDTESDLDWSQHCDTKFLAVDWGFRNTNYWNRKGIPNFSSFDKISKSILGI